MPESDEPCDARALTSRGVRLAKQSHFEEAADCLRQALASDPTYVLAHKNLAIVLESLGDLNGAIESCERLLETNPQPVEIHNKLGSLYAKQGDFDSALNHFRAARALGCNRASVHGDIGSALGSLGRHSEAIAEFRRAIDLDQSCADYHAGVGLALTWTEEFEEAESCLRRALVVGANNAAAHHNIALLLKRTGRIEEALSHYERSLELNPSNAEARKGLAACYFLKGDFGRGFEEYGSRISAGDVPVTHDAPIWDGGDLRGKTLLVETEQGMGDTIQFVRYIADIKKQHPACRIVLACEPQLVALLKGIEGADEVTSQSTPRPHFDCWLPLLSIPHVLGWPLNLFSPRLPYLKADAGRILQWKERLDAVAGMKVGIAWQGNPTHPLDANRSVPLGVFEPLGKVQGVTLVSLQKGHGSEQIPSNPQVPVVSLGNELDSGPDAFLDTAAVISNLDLVVSVDTSVAHLAGAIGAPVWLALAHDPDWRWMVRGDNTPWYPTMKLYRQTKSHGWTSVFDRIASALGDALEIQSQL